jgi:RNA polymerase sigma-70 factor (ECF subfamily)
VRDEHADELLQRAAGGDEAAFAELYDRLAPSVFGMARRIIRNAAQAEDVTQEVMVEVWRTASRFDPVQGSAQTWVVTLAHRRAVDRVRSEESQRQRTERLAEVSAGPGISDPVADDVVDDFDRARVRSALAGLSALQRESVELAFYGGNTHTEISSMLGLPLGTVKTRIRDGLLHLRALMEEGR